MPIPLLVPKQAYALAKELGAEWDRNRHVWLWPTDAPRRDVNGWLPRMYKPGANPPHILPRMIPRSMFGVNLRALIPEAWKKISREFRGDFGNRCQVCGGAPVECHEDWDYIFDASARSDAGIQRLRRLTCLCRDCHALKHLGKTNVQGKTEAAMRHLAFVNGWRVQIAYEQANEAWADWERRNGFQWTLDVSFAEQEYGLQIDVSPGRIAVVQRAANRKFAAPSHDVGSVSTATRPVVLVPHTGPMGVLENLPAADLVERRQRPGATFPPSRSGRWVLIAAAGLGGLSFLAVLAFSPWMRRIIQGPATTTWCFAGACVLSLAFSAVSRRFRRLLLVGLCLTGIALYLRHTYRETRGDVPATQYRYSGKRQARRPPSVAAR